MENPLISKVKMTFRSSDSKDYVYIQDINPTSYKKLLEFVETRYYSTFIHGYVRDNNFYYMIIVEALLPKHKSKIMRILYFQ